MLFVSPVFLFAFLPIMLGLYYLFRGKRKTQNVILFIGSILFYAWGEPWFTPVLILSILANWIIAVIIGKTVEKDDLVKGKSSGICRVLIMIAVSGNIGLLFICKYLDFSIITINSVLGLDIATRNISLPIGISFFTFQALSYVIDVYKGEVRYQKNPMYVGLYISFFPQLIAGPIVRYNTIEKQIGDRIETFRGFSCGVVRFMQGFSKKILLANTMAVIADKAFGMTGNSLVLSFAWLGALAYMLQIYYDFSGYSDMAIGLGKMFGFDFEENFRLPYTASSVTDFWRRWHISLSSWFRDYVYIPLGGSREKKRYKTYVNLLVVWLLTGIWHGANWTFIVWGLVYFFLLLGEKATDYGKWLNNHKAFGKVYTFIVVMFLWVVFRADNLNAAFNYILVMCGSGIKESGVFNGETFVYIKENLIFLIFALLFAMNIPNLAKGYIKKKRLFNNVLSIARVLIFAVSVVYMINETYNPFIYFNF